MILNTSNKLRILFSIFFIGFISLFVVNQLFDSLMEDLDKKTTSYEMEIQIAKYITEDIQNLKILFFKLLLTEKNDLKKQILDQIKLVNYNINQSLNIFEFGGVLERAITIDKINNEDTNHSLLFYKIGENKKLLSFNTINAQSELYEFNVVINEIEKHINNTNNHISSQEKLHQYYALQPSFLDEISKNLKQTLYQGKLELNKIKKEIINKKNDYQNIKIALMTIVLLLTAIVAVWLAKSISRENIKLKQLNNELESKENFVKAILNGQESMVIVSNGYEMLEVNNYIAEFFDEFNNVDDFKKKCACICDKFESEVPDDSYINKRQYGDKTWLEHILSQPDKNFKALIRQNKRDYHFSLVANKKVVDKEGNFIIVISLNNITNEINFQQELSNLNDNLENIVYTKTKELQELNNNLEHKIQLELEKNREKDKQMIQQSRFAALGEMIANIAHQWRQPLSAISSTASSMQMQIELGISEKKDIETSYLDIKKYVNFLNQTIEDFRGFFKNDKTLVAFDIRDSINNSISIIQGTFKDNSITLYLNLQDKALISHGIPNELSQVILNILNNAKDAFYDNKELSKRVAIYTEVTESDNIINIQDNAGGIAEDIIDKIFDPYFTTKHQSQGTGIGLYISRDIIENNMNGRILVNNLTQVIDGESYHGACFKILLRKYKSNIT